jgi:Flp pilus assembly protein protease CpaA
MSGIHPPSGPASAPSLSAYPLDPSTAALRLELPLGLGDVGVVTAVLSAAVLAGGLAWLVTGGAVALPLATVGGITVAAAVADHRTGRIPNGLVLAALVVVGCGWGFVGTLDDRRMSPLGADLLAGLVLSGAPFLFLVWLVAPRLVGGGDWKLLAVCGLAIGYVAPLAALVMVMVGFVVAVLVAAARRARHVRLGPMLALGYAMAIAAAILAPELFQNAYR